MAGKRKSGDIDLQELRLVMGTRTEHREYCRVQDREQGKEYRTGSRGAEYRTGPREKSTGKGTGNTEYRTGHREQSTGQGTENRVQDRAQGIEYMTGHREKSTGRGSGE